MSDEKSPIKAKLTIELKADGVAVAESHDPVLWQQVLAAISAAGDSERTGREKLGSEPSRKLDNVRQLAHIGAATPAAALARELGVAVETLTGAISPSEKAPYLHLDLHVWAAWGRNYPMRGPTSISSTALAATLLVLWFRKSNLGTATVEQAQAVLQTADVIGTNPARAIRNCKWLQLRSENQIVLNPAKIAYAIELARAFCSGEKPQFPE
jgi:hypothetical protein